MVRLENLMQEQKIQKTKGLQAVRWRNFKSFRNSGWINIKPITIFIGPNGSGKTNLLLPLLLLKQTIQSFDPSLRLNTRGEYANLGDYDDIVFQKRSKSAIGFDFKFNVKPLVKKEPLIKQDPPNTILLTFKEYRNRRVDLNDIIVRRDRKQYLNRKKLRDGKYSLSFAEDLSYKDENFKKYTDFIKDDLPRNFLFSGDHLLKKIIESIKGGKSREINLPENMVLYLEVLGYVDFKLRNFLTNISFIGPLRKQPERIYDLSGEIPITVGIQGQDAPQIFYARDSKYFHSKVIEWLRAFSFGDDIAYQDLGNGQFKIMLSRKKQKFHVDYADAGFGLSQIFPMVVEGFNTKSKNTIIAEQPEIHLNSRLQRLLADLFADITKYGKTLIIETHSEHLLLRLRTLIAEGKLPSSEVALYYVDMNNGISKVRPINIDSIGNIRRQDWPQDFFMESVKETLSLATAQMRAKG